MGQDHQDSSDLIFGHNIIDPVSATARGAVKMVKIAIDSPGGCIEPRECYKRRDEDGW